MEDEERGTETTNEPPERRSASSATRNDDRHGPFFEPAQSACITAFSIFKCRKTCLERRVYGGGVCCAVHAFMFVQDKVGRNAVHPYSYVVRALQDRAMGATSLISVWN